MTGPAGGPGGGAPERAIEDRIRDYIVRTARLSVPPHDDDGLVALGFVPSVRMLDLVGFLEDEFGIELRPVDLAPERLATIARMAEMVRARLRSRAPSPRSSS
jgi:acyl carrier protein